MPDVLLRVPVGDQNCDVRSATEFGCCYGTDGGSGFIKQCIHSFWDFFLLANCILRLDLQTELPFALGHIRNPFVSSFLLPGRCINVHFRSLFLILADVGTQLVARVDLRVLSVGQDLRPRFLPLWVELLISFGLGVVVSLVLGSKIVILATVSRHFAASAVAFFGETREETSQIGLG